MIIQSTALYEPTKYNAILHYALMASVHYFSPPLYLLIYTYISKDLCETIPFRHQGGDLQISYYVPTYTYTIYYWVKNQHTT